MLSVGIGSTTIPDPSAIGQGLPIIVANVRTTGIVANQTAQNFLGSTPPAGTYLICASLVITTGFTITGPLLTLGYTDSVGAQSSIMIPATISLLAGASGNGSFILQSTGVAQITYAVTGGTFGACELNAVLMRLV
jgi:hypothetical protein